MKILIDGDMDRVPERQFSCKRCGCIFLAKEGEYVTDRVIYWVCCPCCKLATARYSVCSCSRDVGVCPALQAVPGTMQGNAARE